MDNKPVWRTILSVAFGLFALVRLAMTCNKMSSNSSSSSNYQTQTYQNMTSAIEDSKNNYQNNIQDLSNDIFYESYDSISKLGDSEMAIYRIKKVKKDTLLPLDLTAKINIDANSYIQKNFDDSLKLAVKLPDNTSIFMHSYESKNGDVLDNLKSLKKKKDIQNISLKLDEPNSKFVSYNYKQNGKKYNGYALISKEDGQYTSIEFENNKLSKDELEMKTFVFLSQLTK
ncbi:hypothetical protein A0O34_02495 [Chryseobacterium glaciei]|uniref:Uncharacterized protein n=1 Tax=Chryseobacterium glaciei TaxID=1685010 RepID=A0A172XR54_9FLAO|nr:hypothetical protein [Chryseobacterium glaciei]ANF49489.1 hypothetical protein A0O34_02495 [Chryseobacterium glaciei]